MKLRTILAAGVAAMISAVPAYAGEWSGAYAGVSVGYSDRTDTLNDIGYWMYGGTLDLDSESASLGGQVGHLWQEAEFVYGVELDLTYADTDYSDYHFDETQIDTGGEWTGTLRGRAGITVGSTLLYATAGLALANAEYHWDEDSGAFIHEDDNRLGWIAGFGIERQMEGNWRLRFEVSRIDLGTESIVINDDSGDPDSDYPFDLDTEINSARVSANFPFSM